MKRRFLSVVGLAAGLLVGVTAAVQAQFNYEIQDGTVTITGYTGPGGDVVLPDTINGLPVTSIGEGTFWGCTSLTSVTIGSSVTSIGRSTFHDCTRLASITIPDSVTSIGELAFFNCTGLTGITIPDSLTSIGNSAFSGCSGLTSLTIGRGVSYIGDWVFDGCTGLTRIEVNDLNPDYSSLDGVIFTKSQTELIQCPPGKTGAYIIPDSVTSIGDWAFSGCTSLTSVVIPDSVISIGDWAFSGCISLTSVVIPDSVTSIKHYSFSHCPSLTSVTIPDSVTTIGDNAFSACSSLASITIPDSVTSIEGGAFSFCTSLTSVTIPEGVSSIKSYTFERCTSLASIVIPDSVTSVDGNALSWCTGLISVTIGKGLNRITAELFASCTKLASINISALNPVYSSFDGLVFNKDRTVLILCPRGRSTITIPAGITQIAGNAFEYCAGLQAVYFYGDAPTTSPDAFAYATAALFYLEGTAGWEATLAGRPTVPWNGLFGAQSLELYAGLTIVGEIGQVYSIEYVTDLADPAESEWRCLEYLQLPASPYLWADKSAPATGKRFYRAVAMEAPENMVFIPPGTFRMGSPENEKGRLDHEGPQTEVIISRGFWMGKYEVTQGQYEAVMGNNPSWFTGVRQVWDPGLQVEIDMDYTNPNRPVEQVSWYDATEYCTKRTERDREARKIAPNSVYRLPTEAEWEYACRAGTSTRFSYGDDPGYTNLTNYAWYGPMHPVGQKRPNAWGLYDMHGNAFEWCQDWCGAYPGGIVINPHGPVSGWNRVVRGGYWGHFTGYIYHSRSALRIHYASPEYKAPFVGFRAVLAPGQP